VRDDHSSTSVARLKQKLVLYSFFDAFPFGAVSEEAVIPFLPAWANTFPVSHAASGQAISPQSPTNLMNP